MKLCKCDGFCPMCNNKFKHIFTWAYYARCGLVIEVCNITENKECIPTLYVIHFSVFGCDCYELGRVEGEFDLNALMKYKDEVLSIKGFQAPLFFQSGIFDCKEFFISILQKCKYKAYKVLKKYGPYERVQGFDVPLYYDEVVKPCVSKGKLAIAREVQSVWDKPSRHMYRKEAVEYLELVNKNRDEELDAIIPYFCGPERVWYEEGLFESTFAWVEKLTDGATYFSSFFQSNNPSEFLVT